VPAASATGAAFSDDNFFMLLNTVKVKKVKINFEIYLADRKATTCK